jgi:hypothetical protein
MNFHERGFETSKRIVINRSKCISAFFKHKKVKIDKRVTRKQGHTTIMTWKDLKLVIESFENDAVKVLHPKGNKCYFCTKRIVK